MSDVYEVAVPEVERKLDRLNQTLETLVHQVSLLAQAVDRGNK